MTKTEFLELIDDILEQPLGTLKGDELLETLSTWDSLAVVSFIATTNAMFDVTLDPTAIKGCRSIPDLMGLVDQHLEA